MKVQILKSKIHRVKVTDANLDYIGSITIDEDLMDAANIVITGKYGSGEITVNGAAARKVNIGDILILITYAILDLAEAKNFEPCVVFPNEENNLLE